MTPQDFQDKWGLGGPGYDLNERQGAQTYFLDLCAMLGVPKPGTEPGYLFEEKTEAIGQARGYADVFKRGAFAWENKAPNRNHYALVTKLWIDDYERRRLRGESTDYTKVSGPKPPRNRTLDDAVKQLQGYSLALSSPPLLVACDRITIRLHTQFNGHPSELYEVALEEITQPEKQALLRRIWLDPESFRPKETNREITEKAARSFANLAEQLRNRGQDPEKVAHFLTQCLFCFFAEDAGLLPEDTFKKLLNARLNVNTSKGYTPTQLLANGLADLFETMREGGRWGSESIAWFNGGLFKKVDVPKLEITDLTELRSATTLNWSSIDVSIFGTLFERGLDPSKRSQLGAHYTDPATIMRIIDPVVRRPLLLKWELLTQSLRTQLVKSKKKNDAAYRVAYGQYVGFLDSLADFKILDPACGSGNFLFLGLKTLKDIEHQIITEADALGLERPMDLRTSPANMLGIEINEYAAELARVTVWIGELQWRIAHGYPFKDNPVLEPLDCIEHRDALITQVCAPDTPLQYVEAQWPKVSVIIGNPPFLGDKKMRGELGNAYTEALRKVYEGRVPGGADLVSYWFEKARVALEKNGLGAAGFVATQSVRAGAGRKVLARICETSRIYEAWSDMPWVNDGAAVRVSLVCFGWGGNGCILDGQHVPQITADLNGDSGFDLTTALPLNLNKSTCFVGGMKKGAFDISGSLARHWLSLPNPNQKSNAVVLKPWINGLDVTGKSLDHWIVDFGIAMSEQDAALFEAPFAHVVHAVYPQRKTVRNELEKRNWWLHARPAPDLRAGIENLMRVIVTPRVAKHRFFVWVDTPAILDGRLAVIARQDDTSFGLLNSRIHEVWSLANASIHGDGDEGGRPTYNARSCFETFPFPSGLTPLETAHQRTEQLEDGALIPADIFKPNQAVAQQKIAGAAIKYEATRNAAMAIASAAKHLNDLREAWLNPPEWTHRVPEVVPLGMATSPYPDRILPRDNISEADLKALQKRTLTNLYNQRPSWLAMAHQQLDAAVATAYGWADYSPDMPDADILARLLALNHERSAA
jgi:hypothetical protein